MKRVYSLQLTVYRGQPLLLAWFFLFTVHCTLYTPAFADVIYDKAGATVKGLVVEEHHDRIVMSTEEGEKTILREALEEVFYSEPERNYYYLGNQALAEGELSIARGFFQKATQISSTFKEAGEALSRLEDLERKQAEPRSPRPEELLRQTWGMTLGAGEEMPAVSRVELRSAADRAGILPGDMLAAYWDASLGFLSPDEAAAFLVGPAGTTLRVTIRRRLELPARQVPAGPARSQGSWPGVRLEMERLGLTAAEVTPGGAAASAGLREKDRILRLGEKSTRYLPLAQARRLLQESAEEGLTLVIHRDLIIRREGR